MKRRGHSLDAIISAVKQHALGMLATEVARKMGVAEATFYRWERAYGGPDPDEVRLMWLRVVRRLPPELGGGLMRSRSRAGI
jgi:DNA-binding transcriptional regulator YiaG